MDGALFLVFNNLVVIDIAFGFENPGYTLTYFVVETHHAFSAVTRCVADAGQHVCDWITDRHRVLPLLPLLIVPEQMSIDSFVCLSACFLPTSLTHPRDLAFESKLAEHDARDTELAVHASCTTGEFATANMTGRVLRSAFALGDLTFTGHSLDPLSLLLWLRLDERHTEFRKNELTEFGVRFAKAEVDVHPMGEVLVSHIDLREHTLLGQPH